MDRVRLAKRKLNTSVKNATRLFWRLWGCCQHRKTGSKKLNTCLWSGELSEDPLRDLSETLTCAGVKFVPWRPGKTFIVRFDILCSQSLRSPALVSRLLARPLRYYTWSSGTRVVGPPQWGSSGDTIDVTSSPVRRFETWRSRVGVKVASRMVR